MRWRSAVVLAALLGAVTAGCSDKSSVGDKSLLEFDEQTSGPLGQRSASPTAKPSTTSTRKTPVVVTTTKRATATAKASTGPQVALTIKINGDTAGKSQFDPSAARIFSGTCVQWTNVDKIARSVIADAGSFNSGSIQPGKSWTYCPKATGKFNYHDGTRPYAVAYLEVLPR